ncbi:MAG: lysostaphin resistance A-like protein [Dehalococcoidia bacterium]
MSSLGQTAEPFPSVPWGSRELLQGVVLVGLVGIVGLVLAPILLPRLGSPVAAATLAFTALLSVIMLLTAWRLGPQKYRASLALLGVRQPTTRHALLLPWLVLLAVLVFNALYGLLVSLQGWEVLEPPLLPPGLGLEGAAQLWSLLLVVMLGPLAEEVFFRGFLFAGLLPYLGVPGAVGLSAAVFSLAHAAPGAMLPAFFTGLLLAWLYHRTRTIWSPFLAHAAQNAVALAVISSL